MRAATRPCLSKTTVVGIAFAGKVLRKPNSSESSMKLGYGTANWRENTSAFAKLSRVRIPMNCTSEYFLESAINAGISARQGEHHDAQTFTTAIFFSVKSNLVPYKVSPLSFGASWRSAGEIKVTEPFQDM